MKNHNADIDHVTETEIFESSRWRTAAILKRVYLHISAVVYPISIKFGVPMQMSIPRMDSWRNIKIQCKFKMADGRHIENQFWQYLSAILAD